MTSFDASTNHNSWRLVDVAVPNDLLELVADALWGLGVVAIEEIPQDDNDVTLRTSMGDNPQSVLTSLVERFPNIRVTTVNVDRSVADTWREFAEPTHVADDVYLVPAWLEAPLNSRSIFIEPLDTFGLGNHPTTVLALRLALQHVQPESTVFDFGSGSGVLAVAVAKFLSCSVFAYDIADSARQALSINASRNEVTTCQWCNGFPSHPVDVVLANILAPVLISEAEKIRTAASKGGLIVLSGMRDNQVGNVLLSYPQCEEIERAERDGWVAVALKKK